MPSFPAGVRVVLPQTRGCGEFTGSLVLEKETERGAGRVTYTDYS